MTHDPANGDSEHRYRKLTEIGIALSAEKNLSRLLEMILLEAQSIANADGGAIYLCVDDDETYAPPDGARIDQRAGGDRRGRRGRRSVPKHGDGRDETRSRRGGHDRRGLKGRLEFAIVRNDRLGVALGGTTGREIPYPAVPLHDAATGKSNVRSLPARVAITDETLNIADARAAPDIDFSDTRAFDAAPGYDAVAYLTIPMKSKGDEVIGVLQLINARDGASGDVVPFDPAQQKVIEALASQAAVALDNRMLLEGQRNLLDAFIQLIADAIDKKSPYTGGHCKRVPALTEMFADAASAQTSGPFKDFDLNDEERYELHIAAWLHDCGKVTTPEHVVDKATKLKTIHDRIETVATRFEVLKRDAEIAYLKGDTDEAEFHSRIARIDDDRAFLEDTNLGGEFMDPEKQARVRRIAKLQWRGPDGRNRDLLNAEEVENLCVSRGTLTPDERRIIDDHIVATVEMLRKLPFPKGLRRVPEYAGGHHEKMDGSGFPRGLTREQMSIPARMMAIVDIFEALTAADRPYKSAQTLSESIAIMARMRDDDHIDADLFDLFVGAGVYRKYAEAFLSPAQIDAVDHAAVLRHAAPSAGDRAAPRRARN